MCCTHVQMSGTSAGTAGMTGSTDPIEHTFSSPGAFVTTLITTSTLEGVIAALFALAVVLYVMPALLLCTGKEDWFAYSNVLEATGPETGPETGENKMNSVAMIFVTVWVMVIARTLFDWFTVQHSFPNEPIVSSLFGALCAGIAVCAIGCAKRIAYGLAVVITLVIISLYIQDHSTRSIIIIVLIFLGVIVVLATKGWVEASIMTGVVGFLCSWSLVYCVLFWMSPIRTRLDDATVDLTTVAQADDTDSYPRMVHLLSVFALFLVNVTLCMAWACVKRCKHRILKPSAEQTRATEMRNEMVKAFREMNSSRTRDSTSATRGTTATTTRASDVAISISGTGPGDDSSSDDDGAAEPAPLYNLDGLSPFQRSQLAAQLAAAAAM